MRDTNMFLLTRSSSLFQVQLAHLNPLIVSSTSSWIIGCHNYTQEHTLHVSRDFHLYLPRHIFSLGTLFEKSCKNIIFERNQEKGSNQGNFLILCSLITIKRTNQNATSNFIQRLIRFCYSKRRTCVLQSRKISMHVNFLRTCGNLFPYQDTFCFQRCHLKTGTR